MSNQIGDYIDTSIPVIAEIEQKYGSNLERMSGFQKIVLFAGLALNTDRIQNDNSVKEIRELNERIHQEITKDNEEQFRALIRILAKGLTYRSIGYYVDTNIPVVGDIEKEYGSNLEKMSEQDKVYLANELLFHFDEKFIVGERTEKVRDFEERIMQEITDQNVMQELIKAITNSLEMERIYSLKDILNMMEPN